MFYGFFPPWASVLFGLAVVAGIAAFVMALIIIYRLDTRNPAGKGLIIATIVVALSGGGFTAIAAIQAYNAQVALFEHASKQGLTHVDSIDGVTGTVHVYNTTGNCYVYTWYDPYQKALVLDAARLRNSTMSLDGTTVYKLTTKPLTQEGVNQLCEARYGEDAFNNDE